MKAIFCNNLEESTDRRIKMTQLFEKMGIKKEVYRFDAIKGTLLENNPTKLSPGKTGNILSHVSIWKHISSLDDGFYMVMEDDLGFAEEVQGDDFQGKVNHMISHFPADIGMVHCTREAHKMFSKSLLMKKLKPVPEKISHFEHKSVFRTSWIYPWSTETGAYMIRPKHAGKLYRYTRGMLAIDKYVPWRNNVDLLISRTHLANTTGALVKIFQQNIDASVIDKVNSEKTSTQNKKIIYDQHFFDHPDIRLEKWKF